MDEQKSRNSQNTPEKEQLQEFALFYTKAIVTPVNILWLLTHGQTEERDKKQIHTYKEN